MIKEVSITNFQSHAATTFALGAGVNAIVGESDKGKSAIIRSILWVLTNRPSGDSIWSDWARGSEPCEVTITTTEHVVTRRREKKRNAYIVDGVELNAVGVDVPAEVISALNLSDVNIQRQMDAPFLLSGSAGEVSRFFNSVLSMEDIDASMTVMTAKRRDNIANIRQANEKQKELTTQIAALDWVDGAEKKADEVQQIAEELTAKTATLNAVEMLIEHAEVVRSQIADASRLAALEPDAVRLSEIAEELARKTEALRRLELLTADAEKITHQRNKAAEFAALEPKAEALSKIALQLKERLDLVERIERIAKSGAEAKSNIDRYTVEIKTLTAQLPELCPTCGAKLETHK